MFKPNYRLLDANRSEFKKYDVTRNILVYLNQQSDKMLGVRRKLLQRVIEFDSFGTCYPNDKDRARANVADIQKLVKKKDLAEFFSEVIKNMKLYKNPKPVINISNLKDIDFSLYL